MYLDIFPEVSWCSYGVKGYSKGEWLPCTLTGNYHIVITDTTITAYFEASFTYFTYIDVEEDTRTLFEKLIRVPKSQKQIKHDETRWFDENHLRLRVVDRRQFNTMETHTSEMPKV